MGNDNRVRNLLSSYRPNVLQSIFAGQCINWSVALESQSFLLQKTIAISALPQGACRNVLKNAVGDDRVKHLSFYYAYFLPLDLNSDYQQSVFLIRLVESIIICSSSYWIQTIFSSTGWWRRLPGSLGDLIGTQAYLNNKVHLNDRTLIISGGNFHTYRVLFRTPFFLHLRLTKYSVNIKFPPCRDLYELIVFQLTFSKHTLC